MTKRSEVAKLAGVAESTISYALSGSRPISKETKKRIFDAISELDYKPNAMAAALRSGNSKMIALVFEAVNHGISQSDIGYLLGACDAARELGYNLFLWPVHNRRIDEVIKQVESGMLDGVMLMEIRLNDSRVNRLKKLGIPVALIGRTKNPEKEIYADRDFDGAIRIALQALIEMGHKKIAYLSTSQEQFENGFGAIVRAQNYASQFSQENNLTLSILNADVTDEAGVALGQQFVKKRQRPTALVSINSEAVAGFSRTVQRAGVKIPQDLSIICIDSNEVEALAQSPALSTVSPPAAEIGAAAVTSLVKRLAHLDIPEPAKLLTGKLVLRESTGPAPTIST